MSETSEAKTAVATRRGFKNRGWFALGCGVSFLLLGLGDFLERKGIIHGTIIASFIMMGGGIMFLFMGRNFLNKTEFVVEEAPKP